MGYTIQNFEDGKILTAKELNHIESGIKSLESEIISSNNSKYATEYTAAEDELVGKVRDNVDGNTIIFLLVTDTHVTNVASFEQANVCRKIAERIGVNAIVHLGDMIDEHVKEGDDGSLDRLMRYMEYTNYSNIPFLHAIAHHEKYGTVIYPSNESDFEYYLTNDQVAGQTIKQYDKYLSATRDKNNIFNYYIDFIHQSLRCIFIDSVYMRWGFDENTINWVSKVLSETNENMSVMFFAHVPCLAKANFRNTLVNESLMLDVLNGFVDNGGCILGYSHGHIHGDNIVEGKEVKFPIIATTCCVNRGMSADSTSPKYNENLIYYSDRSGINKYAIDILCIHPDKKKLNYFRFGVGSDREVDSIYYNRYNITGNVTNGTIPENLTIKEDSTMDIDIIPNIGYLYPTNADLIVVENAQLVSYNNDNGKLTINNATGNVIITCECEKINGNIVNIETGNYAISGTNGAASSLASRAATIDFFTNSDVDIIYSNNNITEWYVYLYDKDGVFLGLLNSNKDGITSKEKGDYFIGNNSDIVNISIFDNEYKFKVCGYSGNGSGSITDTNLWTFIKL